MEKPYLIIPYYCFWGVLLRLGGSITAARQPVVLQDGYIIGRGALEARDVRSVKIKFLNQSDKQYSSFSQVICRWHGEVKVMVRIRSK